MESNILQITREQVLLYAANRSGSAKVTKSTTKWVDPKTAAMVKPCPLFFPSFLGDDTGQ